ncbi:MAG TPA: hypothetical protein VEZ11_13510 [Thermoanaerobaculia bacterium]|nr:hypothetical protein [Thermoanaerobaculia bacterium]
MSKLRTPKDDHNGIALVGLDNVQAQSFLTAIKAGLEAEFNALAGRWAAETAHLSSTHDAVMNENYQKIIGMGPDALPLILNRLRKQPDHWFWALRAITRANPVEPELRGNVKAMADRWLEWGRQKGLIA